MIWMSGLPSPFRIGFRLKVLSADVVANTPCPRMAAYSAPSAARSAHDAVGDRIGEIGKSAGGPHSVVMADEHDLAGPGPEAPQYVWVRVRFDDVRGCSQQTGADPRDELSAAGQ